MKKCEACGAMAPNDAAVCANDGEASFAPAFDVPDAEPVTKPSESEPLFQPSNQPRRKFR